LPISPLNIALFQPRTSKNDIDQAEKNLIDILRKRNYNNYVTQAQAPIKYKISANVLTDPFLKIASEDVERVYQAYA
jgi:hypothetical protein